MADTDKVVGAVPAERVSLGVYEADIPAAMVLDGAVVELGYVDGVLIADVRIPARQP